MALSTCVCEWLIGVLNVIFMLVGLALAVFGCVLLAASGSSFVSSLQTSINDILKGIGGVIDENTITEVDYQQLFLPAGLTLLFVGLFLAGVAFIGWCSNCCGGYNIIRILYVIILSVLLTAQIILVALFFSNVFDSLIQDQVTYLIDNKYVDISSPNLASVGLNVVMLKYQCCGLFGYQDFNSSVKWQRTQNLTLGGTLQTVTLETPIACCKTTGKFPNVFLVNDFCAVSGYTNDTISNWKTGCWGAVTSDLSQYRTGAILIATAIIVIQAVIIAVVVVIIKAN